jgi:predicted glycosyltransferase
MHILFYLGHPAHFHLFKNLIKKFAHIHRVSVLTKKKDVLDDLLKNEGIPYINLLPDGRKNTKLGLLLGLLKRDVKMFGYCLKDKPDIMLGTSPEICHIGKLLNIPSINVNEDDAAAVPLYAKLSYPFATEILTPISCDNGKWNCKSIKYNSFHELAYLHPDYFKPDADILLKYRIKPPYFVLRFSGLDAHHDKGVSGISNEFGEKIIDIIEEKGDVFITSERKLSKAFEKYRMPINPLHIHHILYFADMYIGDSQTMAAESAVLGTPSLRYNDFVRRLGYLDELEDKYNLTFGFKTSDSEKLIEKIKELINNQNLKENWIKNRNKMLSEKINLTDFLAWFIENYYESKKIIKENPDYQFRFL